MQVNPLRARALAAAAAKKAAEEPQPEPVPASVGAESRAEEEGVPTPDTDPLPETGADPEGTDSDQGTDTEEEGSCESESEASESESEEQPPEDIESESSESESEEEGERALGGVVEHCCIVSFHPKEGVIVSAAYPPLPTPVSSCLCQSAMPDGSHKEDSDTVLLSLPGVGLYGVSCTVNARDPAFHRGALQKSVVLLSSRPYFPSMAQCGRIAVAHVVEEA
ncbi:AVL9/DENND6 domain containing protein, partial [Kipferlia bialata]|eukprot:g13333.t1